MLGSTGSRLALSQPLYGDTGGGGGGGGFLNLLGNLGSDIKDSILGLPAGIAGMVTHPIRGLERMGKSYADTYGPLFQGHFGEFAHKLEEHPLGPILDLATVLDLGSTLAARTGLASSEALRVVARDPLGNEALLRTTRGHPLARARGQAYMNIINSDLMKGRRYFGAYSRFGVDRLGDERQILSGTELEALDHARSWKDLSENERKANHILGNFGSLSFADLEAGRIAHERELDPHYTPLDPSQDPLNVIHDPKVRELARNPTEKMMKNLRDARALGQRQLDILQGLGDLTPEQGFARRYLPSKIATGADYLSSREAEKQLQLIDEAIGDNSSEIYDIKNRAIRGVDIAGNKIMAQRNKIRRYSKQQLSVFKNINKWYNDAFGLNTSHERLGLLSDQLDRLTHPLHPLNQPLPGEIPEVFNLKTDELSNFRQFDPAENLQDSPILRPFERDVQEGRPITLSVDQQGNATLQGDENLRLFAAQKAGLETVPVRVERVEAHTPPRPGDLAPQKLSPEQYAGFNLNRQQLRETTPLHEEMVRRTQEERQALEKEIADLQQGAESYKQSAVENFGKEITPSEKFAFEGTAPTKTLTKYRQYDVPDYPAGKELRQSIKEGGIRDHIELTVDDNGMAYISDGNHRLSIAERSGIENVPVRIKRVKQVPEGANATRLSENDLKAFSKAEAAPPVVPEAPTAEAARTFDVAQHREELRQELSAIAPDELGDILDNWDNLTEEQVQRLHKYLKRETSTSGLLSHEQQDERLIGLEGEDRQNEYRKFRLIANQAHQVMRRIEARSKEHMHPDTARIAEAPYGSFNWRGRFKDEESARKKLKSLADRLGLTPEETGKYFTDVNHNHRLTISEKAVSRAKDMMAEAPSAEPVAEIPVRTERRHVPVTRGGTDMGIEQDVKIVGDHMIVSNKTRGGGDVYGHKPVFIVRDAKTGENVRGGFKTQKEAIEWSKNEQRAPEAAPGAGKWSRRGDKDGYDHSSGRASIYDNGAGVGPASGGKRWAVEIDGKWKENVDTLDEAKARVEQELSKSAKPAAPEPVAFPEADKQMPPELRARLDKIEADLQKELKPLNKRLERLQEREDRYARGGGKNVERQNLAERKRHQEEIDRVQREIEKEYKTYNKAVASMLLHHHGLNKLDKLAEDISSSWDELHYHRLARRVMHINAKEQVQKLQQMSEELNAKVPHLVEGWHGGMNEEQIQNHLNDLADKTGNEFLKEHYRAGPIYMPTTDFARQSRHVSEQFSTLLSRMWRRTRDKGEAPSEHQVQGGAMPQVIRRSGVYRNSGLMLRLGHFIMGQDALTPQFLNTARYAYYRGLWAKAAESARATNTLEKGEVWLKRPRPSGTQEDVPHLLESMKGKPRSDLDEALSEPLTTTNEAEAMPAPGEEGRYLAINKNIADAMLGEFKRSNYFAQKLVENPMTVWRALVLNWRVGWLTNNGLGIALMFALKSMGPSGLAAVRDMAMQTAGKHVVQQMDAMIHDPELADQIQLSTAARRSRMQGPGPGFTPGVIEKELPHGFGEAWARKEHPGQLQGTFIQSQELNDAVDKLGRTMRFLKKGLSGAERGMERKARLLQLNAVLRDTFKGEIPRFENFVKDMHGNMVHIQEYVSKRYEENPELRKLVNQEVDDAMGNYLSLNPTERRVIRRFLPFYAWYKAIGRVALRLALDDPLKLNIMTKLGQLGEDINSDIVGGKLPDYLRGAIFLRGGANPQVLNLTRANPFASIADMGAAATALVAGHPGQAIGKPVSQLENPFLTAFIENMTGRSLFYDTPVKGPPAGLVGNMTWGVARQTPQARLAAQMLGIGQPDPFKSIYADRAGPLEPWPYLGYAGIPLRSLNMAQLSGRIQR